MGHVAQKVLYFTCTSDKENVEILYYKKNLSGHYITLHYMI